MISIQDGFKKLLILSFFSLFILIAACVNKHIDTGRFIYLRSVFMPEKGNYDNQCGPIAEFQVLRYHRYTYTLDEISKAMLWDNDIGNISDSHLNHGIMLKKFDIPHDIKIFAKQKHIDLSLEQDCPPIVLIRLGTIFQLHWIVVIGAEPDGYLISWGDGKIYKMTYERFFSRFTGSAIFIKRTQQ